MADVNPVDPSENMAMNPALKSCADTLSTNNPFKLWGTPGDNEVQLAESLNQELNRIAAAPVTVYLLLDTQVDKLYGETSNSRYGEPIFNVTGQYSPTPLKLELSKWGIDSDIDMVIVFTRNELFNKCKRLLQHGDLILDYDNRLFEVTDIYDDSNFKFQWVNQYVMCKRKLGDTGYLLGEYNNPNEAAPRDFPPEDAGDLPPSPEKKKQDIKYDTLYGEVS